jgi:transcriptional regulator of arginine metabolism
LVNEFVRDIRRAQNLLVIKTIPGSAQPVAVAIDAEAWSEVVGTVAGDDTLLIITGDNKTAKTMQARLEAMRV